MEINQTQSDVIYYSWWNIKWNTKSWIKDMYSHGVTSFFSFSELFPY